MRGIALIFAVCAAILWLPVRSASAEKVKTNQSTKLFARPGEQEKVILTVKSGQNMTLLAQDGRWLKVRVSGRTGYVPRSKVDMPDTEEIVRNTRRRPFVDGRSTKRGFGGDSPDDRVGADATGDGGDSSGDKGDKADKDDDDSSSSSKSKAKSKAKAKSKGDDDDSDDADDSSSKSKAKAKAKAKSKGGDDSDDEEEVKVADDDKSSDDSGDEARPTAHVSEKSTVYNDRDKDSGELFVAKPSMVLYPGETKGKWTFVENDDGDGGWILSSQLDVDDAGGGANPHKRSIDVRARLGVSFIQQGMRTAGSTLMNTGTNFNVDNYNLGTSAVSLALGGEVLYPYGKTGVIGAELAYDYARAVPGIHYNMIDTGVSIHNLNIRGEYGYDLKKKNGMMLFGRLGLRYEGFQVNVTNYTDPKQNPALLPSENLYAPTLGAALAIPKLTDKIGMKVALDAVLFGASISQTKALEDGSSPSAKLVCLEGVFRYHWKQDMDLQGMYDLNYGSYDFGKPVATSMRGHTGNDVQRTDIFHTVTFGIAKGF